MAKTKRRSTSKNKATSKKKTKRKPAKRKATKKKAAKKKKATKKKPAKKKKATKKKSAKKKPAAPRRKAAPKPKRRKAPSPAKQTSLALGGQPQVGDKAPPFDLEADDGKRYSLSSMAGKRFVLYFYPKDDTPGCTKEACEFSTIDGFKAQGIEVLGVSRDSLERHAKFRKKYKLSVTLLSDPDTSVAAAYGAWGEKKLYGRTVVGSIRSTFVIGPEGRLEQVFRPVRKAAGHAYKVLDALGGD